MPLKHLLILTTALLAFSTSAMHADTIAYGNAAGVPGRQNFGNSLGLDFDVNSPIVVTQLGAFNDGDPNLLAGVSGGLGVTVAIYDRVTQTQVGQEVTFTPSNPGTQVNGDAFLPVVPFTLEAGFQGSIVAFNDPNYNSEGSPNTTSVTDDGGGAISFVGGGRYSFSSSITFPQTADGGPANRYDAGTFQFVPEPGSLALLGVGGLAALLRRSRRGVNASRELVRPES